MVYIDPSRMGILGWDFGDMASNMGIAITNFIAGEDLKPEVNAADVQNKYNTQRDGVRTKAGEIGFQGEFRPQKVLDEDEFEADDVATLRAKVDQINIKAVSDLVSAWNTIGDRAKTTLDTFNAAMQRATDESIWKGASRDAALAGVRDYVTKSAQLINSAKLTSSKLAELQTGLEPTLALVPHAPEHRSGVDNLRSTIAGRGWRNDDVAEYNAKVEAVRVLTTVYAPVIRESDTGVPYIPRPHNPLSNDDGNRNGNGNGNGDGNGSGNGSGGGTGNGGGTSVEPEQPTETGGEDTGTEEQDPSTTAASTDTGTTTPQSTTPASTSTSPASTSTSGLPGAATTGFPGRGGGAGGRGSGSGGSGGSAPGLGRSLPGGQGAGGTAVNPAAARTGAAAGGLGRSGMPGMMSPGARGGNASEEETKKGVPDYLINQENGNELTGLDSMAKTVPPVIGE
ncbi:hypothetical protein [Nocardia cyriacigeorgica]|uniref:hypothetical protein n=1 Tax=Nocardia cyriacigeorgica TaxID=135487 RepID=UPI0024567497|nr:hypothetical protein [Nocardia cyriacigeorgica]